MKLKFLKFYFSILKGRGWDGCEVHFAKKICFRIKKNNPGRGNRNKLNLCVEKLHKFVILLISFSFTGYSS